MTVPFGGLDPGGLSLTGLDLSLTASVAAGIGGIFGWIVCLVLLRRRRLAAEKSRAELRGELQEMLRAQQAECSEQIAQIGRSVALLESSSQTIDASRAGFTRAVRAQAMQMLRSGMAPASISAALGIGKREIRLIAEVARTLTFDADHQLKSSENAVEV
ncbi:MAG TPA: hypothetical protein VHZ74_24755 [Bryobacteraceae bacterium]|jgi:hypothetical protein|nr:hypothetical protein [Bryobacteraceae bacterium]